jgi:thioredoxin reductase
MSTQTDVIIIGAGSAGLSAAKEKRIRKISKKSSNHEHSQFSYIIYGDLFLTFC